MAGALPAAKILASEALALQRSCGHAEADCKTPAYEFASCSSTILFIVSRKSLMKGRQQGRPTKRVTATMKEQVDVGKPGVKFEVWEKWKKNRRKLGTLTVTVGGLRWRPHKGKLSKQLNWDTFAQWFERE